ncbi:unnamed protein product [Rhizophagus irregularis]|uniref:LITAF domain-containing protein n=1 Tax=Rhizophagus irregularis TaxID=588596 RepID=A0A2I1FWL1_9GLOM|nr:hypothetical protein RhiirA4_392469 [Rhizophagus irregularis]CAB4423919.1 unnamed protein product [Rhizophagus irregularis]
MTEDNNASFPEPPPPSTLTTNSTTSTNREVYDGGPNERTPLNQQPKPINNFQATGQNNPPGRDAPNWTKCPNCSQSDYSRIEYRSPPRCSCWCCLCNSIYCFIPICTGGSKDIIHTCPRCSYEIERYTRYGGIC